ncbi:MAG: hypothetical protein AB6733_07645 [Clostridiaceae bacterium]
MDCFDIPVVLFFFKRDKILQILERVSLVQPKKIYLISDEGRNDDEKKLVSHCRDLVENAITWNCEIIKNYAKENKGVYDRIGLGAKWVFSMESEAIFLEDDNLPDLTFFNYCKVLLEKYKSDTRVLWICGTNYLGKYTPYDKSSYMFTKHMLPCGWASWSDKFNRFYDGEVSFCDDPILMKRLEKEYDNKSLAKQQIETAIGERQHFLKNESMISWDYQMDIAIRVNGLYGISPCVNLIENIGVDEHSIHGGSSFNNIMIKRFCGIKTYPMQFPLKHPKVILTDLNYEKKVANIILFPLSIRIRVIIGKLIRRIFNISKDQSIKEGLFLKFKIKK